MVKMSIPYVLFAFTALSFGFRGTAGLIAQLEYMFTYSDTTYFSLYQPNSDTPTIFTPNNASAISSLPNFDPSLPMRIILAGLFYNESRAPMIPLYFDKCGNFNVVTVDWRQGADTLIIPLAEFNVQFAGLALAAFLTTLQEVGVSMANVNLAGEGLGAHVAGDAGNRIGNISAIVAADPARVFFIRSVSRGDAEYVEAVFSSILYGMWASIGDSNFYINDGFMQPGCAFLDIVCDHLFASRRLLDALCVSSYTGCREHKSDDCGYVMGGEPLQVYSGNFDVKIGE